MLVKPINTQKHSDAKQPENGHKKIQILFFQLITPSVRIYYPKKTHLASLTVQVQYL